MTAEHTHNGNEHAHPQAVSQMSAAASAWLDSLSADQKAKATFEYMDGERIFWYYPPMNRHGLALRDMDENQRKLAFTILESGLSPVAYQRTRQIIEHEAILKDVEDKAGIVSFRRDSELYYFTIFGDPSDDENPWAWRTEGHHVSLHYSLWGDNVISTTPFFFGANPSEVRDGPQKGMRILGTREDLGLELIQSFDSSQKSKAIIYDEAPFDILTYNASRAVFQREEGLTGSKMSGTQQEMMMAIISEYIAGVREDVASDKLRQVQEKGLGNFHFAWGGGTERYSKHYYRIHADNFIIEYDNRQDEANHIHSVLRDVDNDFANDVLRDHLILYHVL